MTKVYGWMASALLLSGLVAYYTATSETIMTALLTNPFLMIGAIIVELLLVFVLSAAIHRMSVGMAIATFFLYAAVTGFTLSTVFLAYTVASLASTFFITAGMFGVLAVVGSFVKADLSVLGRFLLFALVGLILASIVNIFLQSPLLYWITTYAGVLIFSGLIVYDTQKLNQLALAMPTDSEEAYKYSIRGALSLYLDFINLFLYLLRLFGNRR